MGSTEESSRKRVIAELLCAVTGVTEPTMSPKDPADSLMDCVDAFELGRCKVGL
jgi:hypothetical protein